MNEIINKKINEIYQQYLKLNLQLQDPKISQDIDQYTNISQQIKQFTKIGKLMVENTKLVQKKLEWEKLMVKDPELVNDIKQELSKINGEIRKIEAQILTCWNNEYISASNVKSVIIELRSATGGLEASLFVANVLNMYTNYFKKNKWNYRFLTVRSNRNGGYSYVVLIVNNPAAYNKLKYEAGVHRVQRVPKTETQGRVHTSTITVAILEKKEAKDFPIDPKDLRIDTFRSSGAGGQSVNTTDSAVRVLHIPTGLMVSCQDGRSQHDNKDRALEVLRARLYQKQHDEAALSKTQKRQTQIGTGMRNEKIRTYNYPQNRITDHRIKSNFSGIDAIMNGNLEKIINKLVISLTSSSRDHES